MGLREKTNIANKYNLIISVFPEYLFFIFFNDAMISYSLNHIS